MPYAGMEIYLPSALEAVRDALSKKRFRARERRDVPNEGHLHRGQVSLVSPVWVEVGISGLAEFRSRV